MGIPASYFFFFFFFNHCCIARYILDAAQPTEQHPALLLFSVRNTGLTLTLRPRVYKGYLDDMIWGLTSSDVGLTDVEFRSGVEVEVAVLGFPS